MPDGPQRALLVFRSAALGDFILGCPALALLREQYPSSRIVLLTIQSASREQRTKVSAYAGGAEAAPWVRLAMPHLVDEVVVLSDVQSSSAIRAARKSLQSFAFERVVLLLDPAAPWLGRIKKLLLMLMLVGCVPVLGWRGRGSLHGNRARLKQTGILRHHVHGSLQFLAELRPPRTHRDADIRFDLRVPPDDSAKAHAWLSENGLIEAELVAVAPGSIQPHKRWPIQQFERLCRLLLQDYPDLRLLVLGTQGDVALGDELRRIDPERVFNLAGRTSVGQSAALLERCTLTVGNDGGAMHLADAMGCRVVSIVPGIEYPDSIEPWNSRELAVRHPVECAPCYDFTKCPRGHNKCMVDLPLERVLANCRTVLAGPKRA